MSRTSLTILASIALATTAGVIFWVLTDSPEPAAPVQTSTSGEAADSTTDLAADDKAEPESISITAGDTGSLESPPVRQTATLSRQEQVEIDPDYDPEWQQFSQFRMAEIQQQLMTDEVPLIDAGAMVDLRERVGDGDREAAFLLYLRYLSCKQTPRTQQNFDAMMDSYIEQRARKDVSEESMQTMEDQMAAMQISFETCSEIDADYDLMAYYWLRTSADMGYLPAMIKYPVDGQQLFYPRLAFKQPELVMEFRNNAIRYLNQALHSGHPSAFLQYAYVYQYDSILDKDPYLIYAYTYAAKLAGFDPMLSGYVDQMLNSAELELDPGQVSDARRMGRDLCERYCRDSQS